MKKTFTVLTIALATLFLTACGDEKTADTKIPKGTSQVLEVLEQQIAKAEGTVTQAPERKSGVNVDAPTPAPGKLPAEAYNGGEGIDLDLTALSATVVYAEVYNMMVNPDAYVGKTVKMKGIMNTLYDEVNDVYYFACIITDATACCAQGIEFVLTEDYKVPDDYPKDGTEVTVVGVFDTYWEFSNLYCTLRNAKLM